VSGGPYSQGVWQVKTCPGCGFVYTDPAPDYSALSHVMAWERTTKVEEQRRAEARPISSPLSKATRFRLRLLPRRQAHDLIARYAAPGNVIDIGCGSGERSLDLSDDFVPYGIEISDALAAKAKIILASRGGTAIHAPASDGLNQFTDGFFTGATLRAYLEHEAQPKAVLNALYRVLAPRGIAIVKVPNYGSLNRRVMGRNWCGFRWPDHLNYFTPKSLAAMAGAAGFTCRFGVLGALPTSDNMWAVLRRV